MKSGRLVHIFSTGGVFLMMESLMITLLLKQLNDANLNHTDMQYFIIRNLPDAWQLRASPHITYDWSATKDNRLTLPIALGIGKMIKIGPMPVMLMAEYQKTLISPDNIGSDDTIMFQANFIIKNPFGSL